MAMRYLGKLKFFKPFFCSPCPALASASAIVSKILIGFYE